MCNQNLDLQFRMSQSWKLLTKKTKHTYISQNFAVQAFYQQHLNELKQQKKKDFKFKLKT